MPLQRRQVLAVASVLPLVPLAAHAHHGWSSFDADRPIYLEGTVRKVRWQNPHAELELELPANLALPPNLAQRALPAQTAPVDGKALLARAVLPTRKDRKWEIELAPLTRMQAWQVAEIKPGAAISVLGFTLREEKGDAVLRVEYLFVDGKVYGLRSSPA
ncbi:DUF6152 family protein [Acidovorax sp. A1169]|uniref:DUF6152 family protein n=1 Tax=Acidovorax sp. A1169 TaxID=3059524 RepID=UPI002737E38E|nr:DUF6152 family protein [Acidovorax sp. A1169]MDP4074255.1 DUF6152 family protein [Acidovorax sp. A1169]